MDSSDIITLPQRISQIYSGCNPQEQECLRTILEELSQYGESSTYKQVWLSDYKEIPVDINTFIENDDYLGKTNRNGAAVYPFWKTTLNEIFENPTKYEECFFTGATRIGKSSTAITATCYMLYRLMCLRDPQRYFGKKDVSKFSILFFNITKDLARGVAFREFNDTLRVSPWFNRHGQFSSSERNFYYIPEGGQVIVDFGSDAAHALGQQVFVGFCLSGDTKIVTCNGISTLEKSYRRNESISVMSYDESTQDYLMCDIKAVQITQYTDETIQIKLNDGSVIEGSYSHRLLRSDNKYVTLDELNVGDRLLTVEGFDASITDIKLIHHKEEIPLYDIVGVDTTHNFIIYGNKYNIISHNCDEINFSRAGVKDVMKAKKHMQDLYNTVSARVKGTFRMNGQVYGKIFAVSSKRSDSDFMEAYMQQQIEAGAGAHMYIADRPQWEVLPKSMFSPETFTIAVGDRHKKGFVVPDNQDFPEALEELRQQGYTLLHPPVDMRSDFVADFEIALRDLAGISVPGALSYITQTQISECVGGRRNPFYSDILQIGTSDNYSIEEFFHIEEIDKRFYSMPHFIHLDLSLNDDKTGISDICISGRKDVNDADGKVVSMPMYSHIFSIALQAPRGSNIPYDKIVTFLLWLRKQGLNIQGISRDQFQSEYMGQLLEAKGFGKVPKVSLDRTPDGYMALRSTLAEKRIDLLHVELLEQELIHLQRDSVSGKIDHPVGGCFVGDTEILLADGRSCTIEQLVDEHYSGYENYVYTVNEVSGKIEKRKIKRAFQSKRVNEFLKLTLNDGHVIECTLDHKFMLMDSSYVQAKDLTPNNVLMHMPSANNPQPHIEMKEKISLPSSIPVYDLTIEGTPNYTLGCGIVVHNSKDVADSLAGAVWNSILLNPGVPIAPTKVASAISAVNGNRGIRNVNSPGLSMFPGLRKM